MNMHVPAGMKMGSIEIVVHRADGTIEDYGVVAYTHRNPLRRLLYRIGRALGIKRMKTWTQ